MNNNEKVNMSSPWVIFSKQMEKLFEGDRDISVLYDDSDIKKITLYVDNQDKYEALAKLIPTVKEFGNVKLLINVLPSNRKKCDLELFKIAFKDNPAFANIVTRVLPDGETYIGYVLFKPEVAQYYADNLLDPYGNNNELYADIAKEVFGNKDGIRFSTDLLGREDFDNEPLFSE